MKETLQQPPFERMGRIFAVLGDSTRLRILHHLQGGESSVGGIVDAVHVKQAAVSKQLQILYAAGLLARRREGNQRFYAIADPLIFELCDLVCGKLRQDVMEEARSLGVGKR